MNHKRRVKEQAKADKLRAEGSRLIREANAIEEKLNQETFDYVRANPITTAG